MTAQKSNTILLLETIKAVNYRDKILKMHLRQDMNCLSSKTYVGPQFLNITLSRLPLVFVQQTIVVSQLHSGIGAGVQRPKKPNP